jgi:hypothetical protein
MCNVWRRSEFLLGGLQAAGEERGPRDHIIAVDPRAAEQEMVPPSITHGTTPPRPKTLF